MPPNDVQAEQEHADVVHTADRRRMVLGYVARHEEEEGRKCADVGDFETACHHLERANQCRSDQLALGRAILRYRVAVLRRRPVRRAVRHTANPTALLALSPARTQVRSRQTSPKPTRRKSERPDGESEPPPSAIADADALWRLEQDYQPLPVAVCICPRRILDRWPSGPSRLHCHKCGKAVGR